MQSLKWEIQERFYIVPEFMTECSGEKEWLGLSSKTAIGLAWSTILKLLVTTSAKIDEKSQN